MAETATQDLMEHPFSKSTSQTEKCQKLLETVSSEDSLGIVINADPDAMASALALKRLFWRKLRKVEILHVNAIDRPDNLALIRLLNIKQRRIRSMRGRKLTKWAMVDSQPSHYPPFKNHPFDIIIDHHPIDPASKATFMDIRQEYGANATIMTEYLKSMKIVPSTRLATALFYGIKTDTGNFVRDSLANDINAFKYLYQYANMNTIKKIESSELSRHALDDFRTAIDGLVFIDNMAYVNMGEVKNPDTLVIIADFFMKLSETEWSIVAGLYHEKLIVILRNASFRGNAGKTAKKLFEPWGGSAGGHRSAARAEIPIKAITTEIDNCKDWDSMVLKKLKSLKQKNSLSSKQTSKRSKP
ncbi:MAG: DHH family phosphoesterase [Deltaproteobacteria bacterium]|jgi:nanoRNase/pAp phosphatase (c-di-AMP/oligoRNAs hydrolase)|nr:DHH family phosphoesterase [Deltaproteobacteria bacterium]